MSLRIDMLSETQMAVAAKFMDDNPGVGYRAFAKQCATLAGFEVALSEHQARRLFAKLRVEGSDPSPFASLSDVNVQLGGTSPVADPRSKKVAWAKGWEPRVTLNSQAGEAVSPPIEIAPGDPDPDEDMLISEIWQLDPALWEILPDSLIVNAWQGMTGDKKDNELVWQRQYKARLRRRVKGLAEFPELEADISSRKPRTKTETNRIRKAQRDGAMVLPVADLQAGKKESGGSRALVDRWNLMMDNLIDHLEGMVAAKRLPRTAYVPFLGDLIEQCTERGTGLNGSPFTCDLNNRQQVRLAFRLADQLLMTVADYFDQVVVSAVPGNHGERRGGGSRQVTENGDNFDLEIVEWLAAAFAKNPKAYGHVSFVIPENELAVTLDIAGTIITSVHGHQFRRGTNPSAKAENWWKDTAWTGWANTQDTDLLLSGHYHHFSYIDHGNQKTWIQAPAMEGSRSSVWYAEGGGSTGAKQGLLTFCTLNGQIWGLEVLNGEVI